MITGESLVPPYIPLNSFVQGDLYGTEPAKNYGHVTGSAFYERRNLAERAHRSMLGV